MDLAVALILLCSDKGKVYFIIVIFKHLINLEI